MARGDVIVRISITIDDETKAVTKVWLREDIDLSNINQVQIWMEGKAREVAAIARRGQLPDKGGFS